MPSPNPWDLLVHFWKKRRQGLTWIFLLRRVKKCVCVFFSVAHYFPYNCANRNMKLISRMAVISNIFIMFAQTLGETIQFDFAPQPNKLEPFHSQNSPFSPAIFNGKAPRKSTTHQKKMVILLDDKPLLPKMVVYLNQPIKNGGVCLTSRVIIPSLQLANFTRLAVNCHMTWTRQSTWRSNRMRRGLKKGWLDIP